MNNIKAAKETIKITECGYYEVYGRFFDEVRFAIYGPENGNNITWFRKVFCLSLFLPAGKYLTKKCILTSFLMVIYT